MMTVLLWVLYPIAIQIERGGWWRLLTPVALLALAVDVLANWTELSLLLWQWPGRGVWTFSQRLSILIYVTGWRGDLARKIAPVLNAIAPSGRHI
jgi:hypothetical protein